MRLAAQKCVTLYVSGPILEEFARVLKRDFDTPEQEIKERIETFLEVLEIVNPTIKINLVKDDPDDNKIIEAAIESNADYVVTNDKHLLKIGQYQKIKIVTPAEFLKTIKL